MLIKEWREERVYKNMMKSFTNGITRAFILYTLYSEPMHGYEIVNRINHCFEHAIKTQSINKVPTSKIYPLLNKMEISGIIESEDRLNEKTQKNVKFYKITEKGEQLLFQGRKINHEMFYNEYYKNFINFINGLDEDA